MTDWVFQPKIVGPKEVVHDPPKQQQLQIARATLKDLATTWFHAGLPENIEFSTGMWRSETIESVMAQIEKEFRSSQRIEAAVYLLKYYGIKALVPGVIIYE